MSVDFYDCADLWGEWVKVTSILKNSRYNLNIPIGVAKSDSALTDREIIAKRLRERIKARYSGQKYSVHLFAEELDTSYKTLRNKIGGAIPWSETLKQKACDILCIAPEEEDLYFYICAMPKRKRT